MASGWWAKKQLSDTLQSFVKDESLPVELRLRLSRLALDCATGNRGAWDEVLSEVARHLDNSARRPS